MVFEKNLVTALKDRSNATGQQIAFSFLSPKSEGPETLTYRALDTKAQAVAYALQARAKALGQSLRQTPVLIALPAGLEFLQCYFGCLYSGAIAVPIKYPQLNRPMEHTQNVAADCGAQLVISTEEMQDWLRKALPGKTILAVEDFPEAPEGPWQDPGLGAADIAHLQYTSGSTSAPKGVAINHKNIAHNASDVCNSFQISAASRLLCWLPHYHDLGLVFGCIVPVYSGSLSLLMPPTHFAQRPVRWLQAIQNHSVTHSAAPNFAFDACLAIPPAATAGLDLTAVEALLNGAEPVRAETVQRFATRFGQNGLGADVQCPAYGMAENTLVLSVNGPGFALHRSRFDSDALQQRRLVPAPEVTGRHRELVACNGSPLGSKVKIVNPETLDLCAPGEIGEIWAQGPSVAAGYWHRDALSQQKFHAQIPQQSGDWLRTGDLGGFSGEDLFIIGRLDDVMVLRGINYSPEDIELTVEACDPALEQGGSIVFASEIGTAMRLVVVHEVTRSALRILRRKGGEAAALQQHLVNTIRARVAEQHDLELGALVLLPPKGLPKTHTGKKKRHACRSEFAAGTFTGVATWVSPRHAPAQSQSQSQSQSHTQPETQAPDITSEHATIATRTAAAAAPSQPGDTMAIDMRNNGADFQHEAQPEEQPEKTANLIGWLREYGENRLNSRLMDERRTIPPHVVMDFGNQGLLGMVAPKRYGGLGLRNSEILDVVVQLAAIDTTLASFTVVNNALGLRPILRHAQPELIDRLMPNLASGRELASFAMTEAGAGSNIRNLAAIGRPDGRGGWHLHGTKLWSGTAAWAGVINTFVRLENPTGGGQAVSGFVLEAGSAGLRQGPEALTLGLRAMVQNQVVLDGVKVTADQRLGDIGQGMTAATDAMEYGRFAIAAMSLGVIQRCLQLMLRHGDRRTIATGRLLDNPATNLRISELAAASSAIEALIRTVAAQLDAELPPPPELYCACKSLAPEYAWKAADGLIQQMAGRGYVENNIAPQILRDARVLRIFEGPTEPMNAHIGARLVQFPEELQHYVGTRLGQPGLATELDEMAQQIWQHHLDQPAIWGGLAAAKAQAHLSIGETAAYGLMLACLNHQITAVPGFLPAAVAKRAQDWSRLQFTHSRAKALTQSAALAARLDRAAMDALRDSCAAAIGDVEQQMAGADTDLDGLIRRDRANHSEPQNSDPNHGKHHAAGATNPALQEPAAGEAPAPSEVMGNAATQSVADWIKNWMASEFQIDAAEIEDDARFAAFGMDSVAAMLLTGALETWVGADLPASLVWEHRSIAALANHVAGLPCVQIPRAETLSQPSTESAPRSSETRQGDPQHSVPLASDPMSLLARADELSEAELEALVKDFADAVQEAT